MKLGARTVDNAYFSAILVTSYIELGQSVIQIGEIVTLITVCVLLIMCNPGNIFSVRSATVNLTVKRICLNSLYGSSSKNRANSLNRTYVKSDSSAIVNKLRVISPWKAGADNVLRDNSKWKKILDFVKKSYAFFQVMFSTTPTTTATTTTTTTTSTSATTSTTNATAADTTFSFTNSTAITIALAATATDTTTFSATTSTALNGIGSSFVTILTGNFLSFSLLLEPSDKCS